MIHDEDSGQYQDIPYNKPPHVLFVDEVIGRLIGVLRLHSMQVEVPESDQALVKAFYLDTYEGKSAKVTILCKDPAKRGSGEDATITFTGEGPSIGHALREMLDKVNLQFPLGREYEDPEPPAA